MAKKGRKTECVSYLRVSGDGQINGDGPDRQREANESYAKANGLRIEFEAFDAGVSGVCDMENRDELPLLLDYVEQNSIKVCLVENASRISRKLMVGEIILDEFKKHGCKVIESTSGVELTADDEDETKVLVRQVLACIAEFQKKVDVKKLAAARKRIRQRSGKCEGRKAFGSTPDEYVILKYIDHLRRKPRQTDKKVKTKRLTYQEVTNQLNKQGFTSKSGAKWTWQNVARIAKQTLAASDEFNHTQKDVDEAFIRLNPLSRKQIDLLGGDPVAEIEESDIVLVLACFWAARGTERPWGFKKDDDGMPIMIDGKPVEADPPSEEEQERGRRLWNSIGLDGFNVPQAPKNVIEMAIN